MSPLNSNSKSFTLQQIKTMLQPQFKNVVFFSSFFNLCSDVLSILLKMSVLSFFPFFHMLCSTMFKFLLFLFYFFPSFFYCPVRFCFHFLFTFFFFLFFFHNKLLIQCPLFFFQPYIYLSVFTLTR